MFLSPTVKSNDHGKCPAKNVGTPYAYEASLLFCEGSSTRAAFLGIEGVIHKVLPRSGMP